MSGHGVHPSLQFGPAHSLYVPRGHSVHAMPCELTSHPVEQLIGSQSDAAVEPVLEVVLPTWHDVQASLPMSFLYVPAGHLVQLPFSSVYPALHTHLDTAVEAVVLVVELAGQFVQPALPATPLYVPWGQAFTDDPAPVYPITAIHADTAVRPVAKSVCEPGGHGVHPTAAVRADNAPARYVPAPHG